jgi:hypothetical protein
MGFRSESLPLRYVMREKPPCGARLTPSLHLQDVSQMGQNSPLLAFFSPP